VAEPLGERFFALTGGGLVGWGRGLDGELGTGTMADAGLPVAATAFTAATAVGSDSAVCAVSGGALVCRGMALPPSPPARALIGVTMSELFGCVHDGAVVECFAHGLASIHGVLGDGTTAERLAWGPTGALPAGPAIIDLCSGSQHACVLRDDREVWCWGTRDGWDAGRTGTQALVPELAVTDADGLACGALATCILRGDRVLCGSRYGQMIGVGQRMPPPGFNEVLED
jgi:alpha-tubulin suppressor-like RCC1 family protein